MKSILVATLVTALFSSVANAASEVFIPLGSEGVIAIVDPSRDMVVGRIEGLPDVHGLAATPDGEYLIAGSYTERPATNGMPPKPAGMAQDEHAAHHARNPEASGGVPAAISTVSVVDVGNRSIVRRIDVPGAVHHVSVSPNGRFAVVTQPNQGAISVIDLDTFRVIETVATGPQANYATFSPDGQRVFVSNAGNATVSEVDTVRWIVRRNVIVGAGPEHVVLSTDGKTLFVNNVDDGTVSVINVGEGEVAQTIPIGDNLHGVDLSDDGGTLFVAVTGDEKVVARDLINEGVRELSLSPTPYHLAVIRGMGKIYVSSVQEPKVWVIDASSLEIVGDFQVGGKGHQLVHIQ